MAAEVVSTRIIPAKGQEVLTIMDDYGTELLLHIPVSDSAQRQGRIDAAVALLSSNQTALEAYAATHAISLATERAAGRAKKDKKKGTK
jgi:hypothetical protein